MYDFYYRKSIFGEVIIMEFSAAFEKLIEIEDRISMEPWDIKGVGELVSLSRSTAIDTLHGLMTNEYNNQFDDFDSNYVPYYDEINNILYLTSPVKTAIVLSEYDLANALLDKGYPFENVNPYFGEYEVEDYLVLNIKKQMNPNDPYMGLGVFDYEFPNRDAIVQTVYMLDLLRNSTVIEERLAVRMMNYMNTKALNEPHFFEMTSENGHITADRLGYYLMMDDFYFLEANIVRYCMQLNIQKDSNLDDLEIKYILDLQLIMIRIYMLKSDIQSAIGFLKLLHVYDVVTWNKEWFDGSTALRITGIVVKILEQRKKMLNILERDNEAYNLCMGEMIINLGIIKGCLENVKSNDKSYKAMKIIYYDYVQYIQLKISMNSKPGLDIFGNKFKETYVKLRSHKCNSEFKGFEENICIGTMGVNSILGLLDINKCNEV